MAASLQTILARPLPSPSKIDEGVNEQTYVLNERLTREPKHL